MAVAAAVALAACGGSPSPRSSGHGRATTTTTSASTTTTSSSTTTSTSTTTTTVRVNEGPVNGSEIDRLPTAPPASTTPSTPDLTTSQAQERYLRGVFDDIQSMWKEEFTKAGAPYQPARLVLFSSKVSTACGEQSADVGPFYCTGDRTVYLDTQFFRMLETHFGVKGDFAQAYIVAHEVGHHVQFLVGITARLASAENSDTGMSPQLSVAFELQADCLAGVWAHSAYQRKLLKPGDIDAALRAAQVAGDDYLANAHGATVDPDSFTHGTSEQRKRWFTIGYEKGNAGACDTFSGI